MNRSFAVLTLLVTLAVAGCDSSPTEIAGAPLVFEGTISATDTVIHSFVITNAGGVRIEATSITADPPVAEGFTPTVTMGLGEPGDGDPCTLSFTTTLIEGRRLALGLTEKTYCLQVLNNAALDEGETRSYSILLTSSE